MKYIILFILIISTLHASAQVDNSFNMMGEEEDDGFFYSRGYDILMVGAPLVGVGMLFKPANQEFKALYNDYCYGANTSVDDYLQYSPAALMVGLKLAGVESRSSWGRMLTSDAISVVTMSLLVNSLKISTSIKRPDTSADNSFPSGHTATAFMAATMLHKEYGKRSYWYSVGGYAAATATGMMRMINNRHWISDVLVGAGLGIISTEVGYLLGDLIYRKRGINYKLDERYSHDSWYDIDSPSSLGLYIGAMVPLGMSTASKSESLYFITGGRVGLEGIYGLSKNFGIGGRAAVSSSPIKIDGVMQEDELEIASGAVGCYYFLPLSDRWRFGANLLAGVNYYQDCDLTRNLGINSGVRGAFGSGVSFEYLTNRHWAMRAFCNYDAAYLRELQDTNLHQSMLFGVVGSIIF